MYLRAFAILLSLFYSGAHATTILPPRAVIDLQGQWLGGSEENREEFLRLDVDRSGKGLLIVRYDPEERPAAYKVLSTQVSEYSVEFRLQPVNGGELIYLRGTSYGTGLQMQIGNTEHQWHHKVLLEPEREVLSRIRAVTERAAEFTSSGQ